MPSINSRREGEILVLTIDNERKRNAFTHSMTARLGTLLDEAERDPAVRCIVITGSGSVSFSSGHDLNEMLDDRENASDAELNRPFIMAQEMKTPTIAVINGHAHAAGLILAISCDIRICERHCDFAAPGARIGLLPIGGQLSRLPGLVPLGIAYEILATGRRVHADEALRIGLANQVTETGAGLAAGLETARTIAANSSAVIAGIKTGLGIFVREGLDAAVRFEWGEGRRLQSGPDAGEGMRAFLEKRAPNFTKQSESH